MRISFDFDGVLCLTPFGRLAVHAPSPVDPLPDGYERLYDAPPPGGVLRLGVEYLRFGWRRMAREAPALLRDLAAGSDIYIVTGRSAAGEPLLRRWLRSHHLDDRIAGIHMAPPGLRPPQHKLAIARRLGIEVHIDDDPRTAYHLATQGVPRVFLLDHAGGAGGPHAHDDLPPRLTVIYSLAEFAEAMHGVSGA